jgi:hypothetical protein
VPVPAQFVRCQCAQRAVACDDEYAYLFFHLFPFFSMTRTRPQCIVESDADNSPRWVFVKQRGWGITSSWWCRQGWAVNDAAGTEHGQVEVELAQDVQRRCGDIYSTELELLSTGLTSAMVPCERMRMPSKTCLVGP